MALKKISFQIRPEDAGARLDHLLASKLPEILAVPVSKGKVRKLIVAGAVYLNGSRVRIASKTLRPGAKVEAFVDLEKLLSNETAADRPFLLTKAAILFEDDYLIAIDKPPGLPTQPTVDEARDNLFALVKKFLAERDRVAQPYVGLHHRLDRDTSGVVLFTKRQEANAGIADAFASHDIQKTYQALTVRGKPPSSEWVVKNYLGKKSGSKSKRYTAVRAGGDYAETAFRLIEDLPGGFWLEAQPKTGRTHQIRVHLAEQGLPILGDSTYGASGGDRRLAPRCMLHAARLTFTHPFPQNERSRISIESPLPQDFRECLQKLKNPKN